MEKMTEKIYERRVGYHDHCPKDKEYEIRREKYLEACKKFRMILNQEQNDLFSEIEDYSSAKVAIMESLYFQEGLKVGLRLGFEACEESDIWKD